MCIVFFCFSNFTRIFLFSLCTIYSLAIPQYNKYCYIRIIITKNSCNNTSQTKLKTKTKINTQPIDTIRLQTALCGECATFCDAAGQLFVETMKSERDGRTRLRDARRWRCKPNRKVNKEADQILR